MASIPSIRTWTQSNGIEIEEVDHDYDAHAFAIYAKGKHLITIYADTPGQSSDMRASLDAGEDVRDWEDGYGVSIEMLMIGLIAKEKWGSCK